ncbi:MAG: hypothetical protein QGI83_19265, partial [Candidatus Latescibacteria bacterium]|nr:hypothetical protein [Candidatus Latescibacterota bacterium]
AGFTAGKNLKRKTDLNSEFYASYRRTLSRIMTEQRTYVPRLTIGASRQTINSLLDRGVVDTFRDTTQGTLITVVDSQQVIIPNVTQDLRLSMTQEDDYKHMFSDFVVQTDVMIGRSQMVSLHVGHRRYSENLHLLQVIRDSSRLYQTDPQSGTLVEITDTLRAMGVVGQEQTALDDFLYQDLNFFRSTDFGVTWRYGRFEPAKDRFINPRGGRAITLRYRRINATVTDSLALSADLNQDLVPDPTPSEVSPSIYRADDVKLGVNEYTFSWNEFVPLFGRTTLGLQAFLGYKDQAIKKQVQNGGTFEGVFYYPLRYYLGGFGTLRGYPYFSLSGGKALFCRATFTFPIVQKAGRELPPLFFDKMYGTFFVETGATSDFESLSSWWDSGNRFNRSAFLTDWGFEIRMQMFSNYRLPLFGYFQIAFPTRDRISDRNNPGTVFDIDNRRIYFGLSI